MKDQKELLKKCLVNDIPAIVFQGSDSCAVEILQAAENIYRKNGCSPEFISDFHLNVVENFKAYQKESTDIKLPDLSDGEKAILLYHQEQATKKIPKEISEFKSLLENEKFEASSNTEFIQDGKYMIENDKDYCGIISKNGEFSFAINFSREDSQVNYFIFSDGTKYPERVGDFITFKKCYFDIMYNHPLVQKKSEVVTLAEYYRQKGYCDVSKAIEQYSSAIENISNNDKANYKIENIQICSTKAKEMKGNIIITQQGGKLNTQFDNLQIIDNCTGKIEPIATNNIDLNNQSQESIKKMLSGDKVEMTNKSGVSSMVRLNKTVTGWGISTAKQAFNSMDSSASI